MAHECKHSWRPYTTHKAKCSRCAVARPWTDIVTEYKSRSRVDTRCIKWQARRLDMLRGALKSALLKLGPSTTDNDAN